MTIFSRATVYPVLCLALACASNKPAAAPPAVSDAEPPPPSAAPNATPPSGTPPSTTPVEAAVVPAAPEEPPGAEGASRGPRKFMEVVLQAKSGSKLVGKATLSEKKDGVHIVIQVEGIKPGERGTHIHENGDCSAPDGSSAGGHFNPHAHDHGLPDKEHRHLGDLGNILVGKDGKGTHEIMVLGANLADSDVNSFLGRSIIVHEKKDDGGQPVGNAGGRIGCAEIK